MADLCNQLMHVGFTGSKERADKLASVLNDNGFHDIRDLDCAGPFSEADLNELATDEVVFINNLCEQATDDGRKCTSGSSSSFGVCTRPRDIIETVSEQVKNKRPIERRLIRSNSYNIEITTPTAR